MEEPDFRSSPPARVLDQKDDRWQMPDIAPPSLAAVLKRGLDASAGAASSAICTRRRSDAPSASDVRRAGDARASTFDEVCICACEYSRGILIYMCVLIILCVLMLLNTCHHATKRTNSLSLTL
jgi:hypothetical protein